MDGFTTEIWVDDISSLRVMCRAWDGPCQPQLCLRVRRRGSTGFGSACPSCRARTHAQWVLQLIEDPWSRGGRRACRSAASKGWVGDRWIWEEFGKNFVRVHVATLKARVPVTLRVGDACQFPGLECGIFLARAISRLRQQLSSIGHPSSCACISHPISCIISSFPSVHCAALVLAIASARAPATQLRDDHADNQGRASNLSSVVMGPCVNMGL